MPRKTPIKEIQKEEVVVSSPVRRSSRLSSSSPIPTRVLTRRNSSSEETSQTPKPRGRRLSLTQETETTAELEKKKPTSTIRTRRSSLTQNKDEEVAEPVRVTRSRASSVPKEETPVTRTTRRRGSTSEEPETSEETAKKTTRSKTLSSVKSNESDDAKGAKKKSSTSESAASSTPVKKSGSISEPLESIQEASKEVDSPVEVPTVKSKRKTMEASKIDFDLSIINEASIIEENEEGSPKKTEKEHLEAESEVKTKLQDDSISTKEDSTKAVSESDPMVSKASEIEQKSDTSLVKDTNCHVEAADSTSDVSFNLQLSTSVADNSHENGTDALDCSNKENVRPVQDSEVEPMDVDDSTYNVFSPMPNKSLRASVELKTSDVDQKLQHTEKINDAMAEFLIREIQIPSQDKIEAVNNQEKIQDEVVVVEGDSSNDLTKDLSNDLEMLQNYVKEKASTPNENSDIAEDATEVKDSTVNEEQVKCDGVEESLKSTEQLNASKVEEIKDSSFSAVEDDLKEQAEKGTNEEVSTEIPVEKGEEIDKDLTCKTEQTFEEGIERTTNEHSPKSTPASNKHEVVDPQLDLNNTNERVVVEDVIIGGNERINSAETETLSSEACSVVAQNFASPINEEEIIINVDDSSYDDIGKTSDGDAAVSVLVEKQDETIVMPKTEEEETVDVSDDDLDTKLASFVNVVDERPSPDHNEKADRHDNGPDLGLKPIQNTDENDAPRMEETINLCDSDPDVFNRTDASYASPVKTPKLTPNLNVSDIFKEVGDDSCQEVVIVSDEDKEGENVEDFANGAVNSTVQNNDSVIHDVSEKDRSITIDILDQQTIRKEYVKPEEDGVTEASTSANTSKRHSLEKTTITMQETLKAGDNTEKRLPDRIHQVVDLFCKGLKNKSDVSVNVSLEYTAQPSDNEDENNQLNISLTASEIREHEGSRLKGSKRRKVCIDGDSFVSLDETESQTQSSVTLDETEIQTQIETSPKTSVSVSNEEKPSSAKKRRKQRLTVSEEVPSTPDFKNAGVGKSSPKVSFLENDDLVKKKKHRKSIGDDLETSIENQRKTTPKKAVPLTPYRLPQSDKSTENDDDTTTESTDDEGNDSTTSESKDYNDLLNKSFQEDDRDTTWMPTEGETSISDADATNGSDFTDDSDEEEDELEDLLRDLPINKDEKTASSNDDVFIPNEEKQKDSNKKTRKMFRLSNYNASKMLTSSESDKVVSEEEKPKTKRRKEPTEAATEVVEKKTKRKKKAKRAFQAQNVGNIVPETSEVKMKDAENQNRKRRHQASTSLDEEEEYQRLEAATESSKNEVKKLARLEKKSKKESLVGIQPSRGKSKKRQTSHMKPSSKPCSGWDVTTF